MNEAQLHGAALYDYVVVGGGSAGAVVAARLSEEGEASVLLLEAGPDALNEAIENPTSFHSLWGTGVDWDYRTEPHPAVEGRIIPIPRGRVLGGSSSINGMIHVRGPRADYDHWAKLGNPGWDWESVLPAFERTASLVSSTNDSVILNQIQPGDSAASENAFITACLEYGFDRSIENFNSAEIEDGPAYHHVAVDAHGCRSSSATAFLHTAARSTRLKITTDALVRRVLLANGRAYGVEYEFDGRPHTARARREIVLAAGAVETPKLLTLSGIGPPAVISHLGLPLVVANDHVGAHLQDHLLVGVSYRERRPGTNRVTLGGVGLFTRTRFDVGARGPDLQMQFFPDLRLGSGSLIEDSEAPGFTVAPTLLQPRSEGNVVTVSPDSSFAPVIRAGFLTDGLDTAVLREGIRLAREIVAMPAFRHLEPEELAPSSACVTAAGLDEYVRRNAETTFHPVGTCRMGTPEQGVVDARLRVHGIEALRVIDASVMPRIVSANTNAASLMIGEMGARFILQEQGCPR